MNYTRIDHLTPSRSIGGKSVMLVLMMLVATISGAAVVNNAITLQNKASESAISVEQCSTQGFQVRDGQSCPEGAQFVGTISSSVDGTKLQSGDGQSAGDSIVGGNTTQTPQVCCSPVVVPSKALEITPPTTTTPVPSEPVKNTPTPKACIVPEVIMTMECPDGCLPVAKQ